MPLSVQSVFSSNSEKSCTRRAGNYIVMVSNFNINARGISCLEIYKVFFFFKI
jgi:hypothetical protein